MNKTLDRLQDDVSVVDPDGDVRLADDFPELVGDEFDHLKDASNVDPAIEAAAEASVEPEQARSLPEAARRVVGEVVGLEQPETEEELDARIPADEMAAAVAYEKALEDWNEMVFEIADGKNRDRTVVENEQSHKRPKGESVAELRARYARPKPAE